MITVDNKSETVYPPHPCADFERQKALKQARRDFSKVLKEAQTDLVERLKDFIKEAPKHPI